MGRIGAILASAFWRIWFQTVFPTFLIFLLSAVVIHWGTGQSLVRPSLWLIFLSVPLVATLLTYAFLRRELRPLHEVVRLTGEMAHGSYGARASLDSASDEYRQLSANINALAESLERTERLRRELVSNLAHEIRTPLTNLQGYLEALRDGVIEPKQEALASVHEEVLRLVRLVDALHQLARADAFRQSPIEFAPTDLDGLADQLIRMTRPNAEARRIKLFADLSAEHQLVPVHADSVAQVMRNLLRNAVQYADEGGQIRVQTAIVEDFYRFTCLNTGSGISAEDMPFIFNRFFRSERAKKGVKTGVGIGLAIAKELVEAHGGRIGCESKAGWTLFYFEVPLTHER